MAYKQIPKGYFRTEYPLPHNYPILFQLSLDSTTAKTGTHIPLIQNDLGLVAPDLIIANPEHGSFAEVAHMQCHKNSIIDNLTVRVRAHMAKGAIETDKMRSCDFYILPIYTAFQNRIDAADTKTGISVGDILELTSETTGKSVHPIYNNVNLANGTVLTPHASTTVPLMGMTTDATLEAVSFDEDLFWDAMQFHTSAPMLRKVIGRLQKFHITRDKDITIFFKGVKGMVKRINEFTYCGLLIFSGKEGAKNSMFVAGDVTAIPHLTFRVDVRYDEWNAEFDQTSS